MEYTYRNTEPFAILMSGRPEEPDSHRSIAVYSKVEHDEFRKKGWKPAKEFTEMYRRSITSQHGRWE